MRDVLNGRVLRMLIGFIYVFVPSVPMIKQPPTLSGVVLELASHTIN